MNEEVANIANLAFTGFPTHESCTLFPLELAVIIDAMLKEDEVVQWWEKVNVPSPDIFIYFDLVSNSLASKSSIHPLASLYLKTKEQFLDFNLSYLRLYV